MDIDGNKKVDLDIEKLRLDELKYNLDMAKYNLEWIKFQGDYHKPSIEAAFRYADLAIKSLLILCGGASVALISHFKSNSNILSILVLFASGALMAVLCGAFAYLSQLLFASVTPFTKDNDRPKNDKLKVNFGIIFQILAISLFFAGVCCAAYGLYLAKTAFSGSP